jgi:hypothetical protein
MAIEARNEHRHGHGVHEAYITGRVVAVFSLLNTWPMYAHWSGAQGIRGTSIHWAEMFYTIPSPMRLSAD